MREEIIPIWVEDPEPIACEFGATVEEQPWAREVALTDPDGNRLRIGQRKSGMKELEGA